MNLSSPHPSPIGWERVPGGRVRARLKSPLREAFTILELLLSVAIMTVIVIGLYTVFNQTQKALRGTMSQVDVLESVRATTDIVGRDLEGISYVPLAGYTNLSIARSPISQGVQLNDLSGKALLNTVLQDVFFHRRVGERWSAIGYWVGPMDTNATPPIAIGRLYRFATNFTAAQVRAMGNPALSPENRNAMLSVFNSNRRLAYSAPVMDGVVHFRVIAYGTNGAPLFPTPVSPNRPGQTYLESWQDAYNALPAGNPFRTNGYMAAVLEPPPALSVQCLFSSASFPQGPVALDLEIGVLEPQVVRQYESIAEAQPAEAAKFLARNSGHVQIFRQRIPVRNLPRY